MIPEDQQKIAVESYGYEITPEVRRAYTRHKRKCERLALALGYSKPFLDVGRREVCATKDGTMHVLADDRDPMNLWCSAWSHLECSLYRPQPPSRWIRWKLAVIGFSRWVFA